MNNRHLLKCVRNEDSHCRWFVVSLKTWTVERGECSLWGIQCSLVRRLFRFFNLPVNLWDTVDDDINFAGSLDNSRPRKSRRNTSLLSHRHERVACWEILFDFLSSTDCATSYFIILISVGNTMSSRPALRTFRIEWPLRILSPSLHFSYSKINRYLRKNAGSWS